MGFRYCLVFLAFVGAAVSSGDSVPVLIWRPDTSPASSPESSPESKPIVPGLSKLDNDDFLNYLLIKLKNKKPHILLFVEENLSLEDFIWSDINEEGAFPLLENLTKSAGGSCFLPCVNNPYEAVKKLTDHGYSWQQYSSDARLSLQDDEPVILKVTLSEPDGMEGRPDLLRSHDQEISEIYNNISAMTSNVWGLYTGNHSSWVDADKFFRVKRNSQDDNTNDGLGPDGILWTDNNRTIYIYVQQPSQFQDGSEVFNLADTTINPTIEKMKGAIALDVNFKFKNEQLQVDFFFDGSDSSDWNLDHIVVNEKKDQKMYPSMVIEAPKGYSFYCQKEVLFTDRENQVTLSMRDFQVQPFVKGGKFGPAIYCVPYFSIAIWSGLFIVLILTIVLAWGIVMIMDINTMDRFDDAKGKTITISATE